MARLITAVFIFALFTACSTSGEAVAQDANWTEEVKLLLQRRTASADTTLYLVAHDVQTGKTYGAVWTPKRAFDFEYSDSLSVKDESLTYSPFVLDHLVRWDTSAVRDREQEQGALLGGSRVLAILVTQTGSGQEERRFAFDEFFDSLRAPEEQ